MTPPDTVENSAVVSPDDLAAELGRAVRLFCAANRGWTIDRLAKAAGINAKRFYKIIELNDPLERRPVSGAELLSIWAVIGTGGASHCLAMIGMVAEPEEAAPESLTRAAAGLAMASGKLALIAADGAVTLNEADAADAAADEAIENALAMKAAAGQVRRKARRR